MPERPAYFGVLPTLAFLYRSLPATVTQGGRTVPTLAAGLTQPGLIASTRPFTLNAGLTQPTLIGGGS